jgi:hypothetical protein
LYTPPVTPWELALPEGGAATPGLDPGERTDHGKVSDWGEVVTR